MIACWICDCSIRIGDQYEVVLERIDGSFGLNVTVCSPSIIESIWLCC